MPPPTRVTRDRSDLRSSALSSSMRAGAGSRSAMRSSSRSSSARHIPTPSYASSSSAASYRTRAASPAESLASAGTKRKERDFESDAMSSVGVGGDETSINVVVRCRGRSSREVKENSAVVVKTDGAMGKLVGLSMGANSLSDKTYSFDRVFSQAADQGMVFEETVKPILDEMLAGYNCTIFAYGQTGTGKTYTMSGDMTSTLGMLSDEAGIIPRVLQQLFAKQDNTDNCVKVSFIELYNEELRDLLSADESAKLKIYDDASKRGHSTVVQGMEEKHIKDANEGIKVLQDGSLKRQVAATRCNDLSSRSHTVFTITAYVKRTNENGGEDLVSAGKLNLVDLAGSENIQRSGAENKRAAEAGLINKSLLTLGRVINALVDRSLHIPYRESKLTRLLQDSLGGRTKTCIIATVSPAKANMEETISTLDYAFRAKNIKNKPQINAMLSKKTLLREFTSEIEKLKGELISTRQRNGVYLPNDAYEEMMAQSESQRIVTEEQAAKMETLETNLRNKVQELFSITTTLMGIQKDHEGVSVQLDNTKGVLDQTELVLSTTRKSLADETQLRKAHEETEGKLTEIGGQLIQKLDKTVRDVTGLHAKNKRKSDLQTINRAAWGSSQGQVLDVTSMVERRVLEFQQDQLEHISSISRRMGSFVGEELQKVSATQGFLDEHLESFGESKAQLLVRESKSKEDMDEVLEEIKVIRDSVKDRVGESLQTISQAAEKIAADVLSEMTDFHSQLHNSYSALGKDCKTVFEDLVKRLAAERGENDALRRQLHQATTTISTQNATIPTRAEERIEEKRKQVADDHQKMMTQFSAFLGAQREAQEARDSEDMVQLRKLVADSTALLDETVSDFDKKLDARNEHQGQLVEDVKKSRDQLKNKLKDDWTVAGEHSTSIQATAKSVHAETLRVVDEQVEDLGVKMQDLDDFVSRARCENASHHEAHAQSVQALANTVEQSYSSISSHFKTTFDRVQNLGEGMELDIADMQDEIEPLETQLCQPLADLRDSVTGTTLQEYQPTGETPLKTQYQYPRHLPRTGTREAAAEEKEGDETDVKLEEDSPFATRDIEAVDRDSTIVFADLDTSKATASSPSRPSTTSITSVTSATEKIPPSSARSLREVDPNLAGAGASLTTGAAGFEAPTGIVATGPTDHPAPLLKRPSRVPSASMVRGGVKRPGAAAPAEGRENLPMTVFEQSMSRRKSPRLN